MSLSQLGKRALREMVAGEQDLLRCAEHFRAAGLALIEARQKCERGDWLPWLAKQGIAKSPAYRCIALAEHWPAEANFPRAGSSSQAEVLRLISAEQEIDEEEEIDLPPVTARLLEEMAGKPAQEQHQFFTAHHERIQRIEAKAETRRCDDARQAKLGRIRSKIELALKLAKSLGLAWLVEILDPIPEGLAEEARRKP